MSQQENSLMEEYIKLIEALKWPVTALLIAILFRIDLRTILSRVKTVKYKDAVAEFEKGISELPEPKLGGSLAARVSSLRNRMETSKEDLSPKAQESTTIIILETWWRLERDIAESAASIGLPGGLKREDLFEKLINRLNLSESLLVTYHELARLRQLAVEAQVPLEVSDDVVDLYVYYAQRLGKAIRASSWLADLPKASPILQEGFADDRRNAPLPQTEPTADIMRKV